MSRPLRIEYSNAWYYVFNRGRRCEKIFHGPSDYHLFIELLIQAAKQWNVRVAGYCLMPGNYHLLLQTPSANLSQFMRHVNGVYTQCFNRKHDFDGQLFRGRYKAVLVEESHYLTEILKYIHRNPLRDELVDTLKYQWSSYSGYFFSNKKWNWLYKDFLLDMLSPIKKTRLKTYRDFMSSDESHEIMAFFNSKKTRHLLGSKEFVRWVKDTFFAGKFHEQAPDLLQYLSPSSQAITAAVCNYYRVNDVHLLKVRRGIVNEPRNVAIYLVRTLRRDGLRTIAENFNLSGYSSVSSALGRVRKNLNTNEEFAARVKKVEELIIG
ncbi:MAG: transposase [Desulfobulbaceae bacterium]|nr:transposase [Desulfobulbaceae bacterium]